jgi:hypothetical protein
MFPERSPSALECVATQLSHMSMENSDINLLVISLRGNLNYQTAARRNPSLKGTLYSDLSVNKTNLMACLWGLQLRVLQSALKFAPTIAVRGTVEQVMFPECD